MMTMVCQVDLTMPSSQMSLRVRWVMVQKRNRIHVADRSADMMFTQMATFVGSSVNWVKKLPVSIKNGAPGG